MAHEADRHIHQLVRHIFPRHACLAIDRVKEGGSTRVYRIQRNDDHFYLRILPEPDASFAPEVFVHQLLRARGVRVPDVIYFEHLNEIVCRSVMVTTEIWGTAIGHGGDFPTLRHVLIEAGKDLALINSMPVRGFGWIRRDCEAVVGLQAEYSDVLEWMQQDIDEPLTVLQQAQVLSHQDVQSIRDILEQTRTLFADESACLAHGDFDVTHIYHHNGTYTGIIDLGEIRGTHRWYDLGHFEVENHLLMHHLLDGYSGVQPLTASDWQCIHVSSLLIAVRRLGHRLKKQPGNVYKPDIASILRNLQMLR
jgi:aminoglycoside phosphotransferase